MTDRSASDVVFTFSTETWDDVTRRQFARPPDRIVSHLRTSERVRSLLVVNPWRSAASRAKRVLSHDGEADFPHHPSQWLLQPLRLRRADRPDLRSIEGSYVAYTRVIRANMRRRGIRDAALITVNPFVAAFGDVEPFRSVTYFARDDWASYPPHRHLHDLYLLAYDRMRARGVRVSAVSHVLLDRLRPDAGGIVVSNGVDPRTWQNPAEPTSEMRALTRPVVMYTGTVDGRLSVPALQSIRLHLPDASLVLVGPRDAEAAEAISRGVDGVTMWPSVGQHELAALVRSADVCVVPHVRSALTEAMSPLKIYEYLAAGRRVVATDLAPMHDIHPCVEFARSDEDFGRAVARALAHPVLRENERQRFIAENTWAARCERVLDLALR